MYKYSDHNEKDDISLHDCRATKIVASDDTLSFIFKEGFWVSERNIHNSNKKLSYTDESEVKFKALYEDIESNITIYVFTDTNEENKTIREFIPLDTFVEEINGGMELEFLYSYKGYQSFIFECMIWFDNEPYHKECVIIISADEVVYSWNTLYAEDM
ncbi:MAG: hypothetical protein K2L07_10795 [Lachnospiraceae bacterium]|nr:hypothetical protein [Lachnospiraceae bacterium]